METDSEDIDDLLSWPTVESEVSSIGTLVSSSSSSGSSPSTRTQDDGASVHQSTTDSISVDSDLPLEPWKAGDRWAKADVYYKYYVGNTWDEWKRKEKAKKAKSKLSWKLPSPSGHSSGEEDDEEADEDWELYQGVPADEEQVEEDEDEDDIPSVLTRQPKKSPRGLANDVLNLEDMEKRMLASEQRIMARYGLDYERRPEDLTIVDDLSDDKKMKADEPKGPVKKFHWETSSGYIAPDMSSKEEYTSSDETDSSEDTSDPSEFDSDEEDNMARRSGEPSFGRWDSTSLTSFRDKSGSSLNRRPSVVDSDMLEEEVQVTNKRVMADKNRMLDDWTLQEKRWVFGLRRPRRYLEVPDCSNTGLDMETPFTRSDIDLDSLRETFRHLPTNAPVQVVMWAEQMMLNSYDKKDWYCPALQKARAKAKNMLSFKGALKMPNMVHRIDLSFSKPKRSNRATSVDEAASWRDVCPESYVQNSVMEKAVMWKVENFRRQFNNKFPDRKEPFLCAVNECGVQKFLPWMIRPSLIPQFGNHKELASFVADYFQYRPLPFPDRAPATVSSGTAVLHAKSANCMEMAIVLTCFLRGHCFDAFVVWGIADRDTCLQEKGDSECEQVRREETVPSTKKQRNKYEIAERPLLDSEYDKYMLLGDERETERARSSDEKYLKFLTKMIRKRTPDSYFGKRFHAWVVIRPGMMNLEEEVCIEPTTGESFRYDDVHYFGVEGMFNEENYWINMQDPEEYPKGFSYDVLLTENWMGVVDPMPEVKRPTEPTDSMYQQSSHRKVRPGAKQQPLFFNPTSYVRQLKVPTLDRLNRFPDGTKMNQYRGAVVIKYTPYMYKENMLMRAIKYNRRKSNPTFVRTFFSNRTDRLVVVEEDLKTMEARRIFAFGRPDLIQEHHFPFGTVDKYGQHKLVFNVKRGQDGLLSTERTRTALIKTFSGRADRMHTQIFEKGPLAPGEETMASYPVIIVIEKFERDLRKPCHEDIAEITFLLLKSKVTFVFHGEKHFLTTAYREYAKPPMDSKGLQPIYSPIDTINYRPRLGLPMPSHLDDFNTVYKMQEMAKRFPFDVRLMEEEFSTLCQKIMEEGDESHLYYQTFDVDRNIQAHEERKNKDRDLQEAVFHKLCKKLDILGPYWEKMGCPAQFSVKESRYILEKSMEKLRRQVMKRAETAQGMYHQASMDLHLAKSVFEDTFSEKDPTEDDTNEFKDYCLNKLTTLKVAELRCKEVRNTTYKGYEKMMSEIMRDPRLQFFYNKSGILPTRRGKCSNKRTLGGASMSNYSVGGATSRMQVSRSVVC